MRHLFPVDPYAVHRDAYEDHAPPSRARIAHLLRDGQIPPDEAFDRHLPAELSDVSARFWTPLKVASRAARWFSEHHAESILDIGSGVGKFAVVSALCSDLRVVGVEHRPRLVREANLLAERFEVHDRVSFVESPLAGAQLPAVSGYYLYNPFAENLFGLEDRLDRDVSASLDAFMRDVRATLRILHEAPVGTLLVTYNGFGARIPPSFIQRNVDRALPCVLRLFEKVVPTDGATLGPTEFIEEWPGSDDS